uniref:Putative secreted protein n=1 Tax=Anopheles darlingi TaxID=43151 RepID=A0A2M4DRQ5_ANODA
MLAFFAYRLLPSMMKATCAGIGPARSTRITHRWYHSRLLSRTHVVGDGDDGADVVVAATVPFGAMAVGGPKMESQTRNARFNQDHLLVAGITILSH